MFVLSYETDILFGQMIDKAITTNNSPTTTTKKKTFTRTKKKFKSNSRDHLIWKSMSESRHKIRTNNNNNKKNITKH